jgi:hypothetical protein
MHRPLPARLVAVIVAALLLVAGSGAASAQDAEEPIVGAWIVSVGVEGTPQPFMVLQTYEPGGTVTSENIPVSATDPTAPVDTLYLSTGVGTWERTDAGTYVATVAIMYGDIDGTLLAVETVSWEVEVDASGLRFSGEAAFVATDPVGNEVYGGTSGLIGTRITVLDPGTPVTLPAMAPASTPAA